MASWQKEKELSNLFWLRLIIGIALKVPRSITRLLLYPIVLFFVLVAPQKRSASRHYLKQVLGHQPTWLQVFNLLFYFAAVLLDRIYFLKQDFHLFDVKFYQSQRVIDSLKLQPGQFFLSGHFGSLDSLKSQSLNKNYTIKPVIKLDHNQTIVRLMQELNPQFYESVIAYKGMETTFEIYENLKAGNSIALLADRAIDDGKVIPVQFFEDTLLLPEGIFEMLSRFPFPTQLFFARYEGGNYYEVEYIQFDVASSDTPKILAQRFADCLAEQCQKSPYNWFNFYPYWVKNRVQNED